MSTHFSISLGLLIACGAHLFGFLKIEINQDITVLKKEQTLNVVLSKIPEKKTALEMPVVQEKIEQVEKIETPVQKPVEPSKKVKNKKIIKKQQIKKKPQKKEVIKQVEPQESEPIQESEPTQQNNNVEQLEVPQENTNVTSGEKPQEIASQATIKETKKVENKIKTINCESYSFCPDPKYPFVARQRGIEGQVKLALTIDENGTVVDAKILESEPEDMFEEAALEAVMQYRNLPEQLFNSTVERTIKFKLKP